MKSDFLQDMAPDAKRSFLVSIAFVAVGAALYFLAVNPAESKLAAERKRLSGLENKQSQINRDIKGAGTVKGKIEELEKSLSPYEEAILVPLLGSYSMQAKAKLEQILTEAGLTNLDYTEEPFRALPLPKPVMPKQLHRRAAIRVTARGSYQAAVSFLLRLEKELPLVSLQSFEISAEHNPAKQVISFVLEWPAKGGLTSK